MITNLVLGDSLEVLIDHRGKTPKKLGSDFIQSGVPVASAILVKNGRLDLSAARYVDEPTFLRWMSVRTRKGDVILTSEAPLGRLARVESNEPLVLGQRLFGLRGRSDVLDSGFLYYALQTHIVRSDLIGRSTGTTVVGIRQSALRETVIPAPEIKAQQAIAEMLGSLDEKIAANEILISLVDGLAATLFEHLTKGAPSAPLSDIAAVNVLGVKPTVGTLRYLDISSVGQGNYIYPDEVAWNDAPDRARRKITTGDTVWSTVRPNRRSHALIMDDDRLLVGSTGLAVLSPKPGRVAGLYESTRREAFVAYLEGVAEGSAYPAVRGERFLQAPVPLLENSEWHAFEAQALPLRRRAHAAASESRSLADLRDELLPLLMSGDVTVRAAEHSVAEVV